MHMNFLVEIMIVFMLSYVSLGVHSRYSVFGVVNIISMIANTMITKTFKDIPLLRDAHKGIVSCKNH